MWLQAVVAAMVMPIALAGCSTLSLFEGNLLTSDEDELGIVTSPYPGWETKAKAALDRIPTAEAKEAAAALESGPQRVEQQAANSQISTATAQPAANPATAPASVSSPNTTVTREQPVAPNPATAALPSQQAQLTSPLPPEKVAADLLTSKNPAAPLAATLAATIPATPEAPLHHPTHQRPLEVEGAATSASAAELPADKSKQEPAPAERLAALIKQRSEFVSALRAEVERRRKSTQDQHELRRLEQELRLVHLADEKPDEAVRQIDALEGAEREAFAHLLMGLATWMNADEAHRPTMRNAKIVREIRDAAAHLAAASKLDVRNLAFCEKVESYGWYTEFSRNQFKPKQQVILYAEVENFTALKVGEESYETELQGSYQIFDSRGELVDERQLPVDKEICRNYRRDYFLRYLIYLPDGLSPGAYRLELTVEDLKGSATQQNKPEQLSQRGVRSEEKTLQRSSGTHSAYKGRKLGEGTIEFTIKSS